MDQISALLPFLEMRADRGSALDHFKADLDDDGGLTRSEFVEMCAVVLAVQHVEKAVLVGHRSQCQPLVGPRLELLRRRCSLWRSVGCSRRGSWAVPIPARG